MSNLARLPSAPRPVAMRAVAPADLHRHWTFVRQGLKVCAMKGGGEYLPEDAYHAIKAGNLVLFLLVGAGQPFGFVLLRREEEPSGVVLFVWALYCSSGEGRSREASILDALRRLAVESGAGRIRMWSAREGWKKRGWKEVSKVYQMEV